MFKTTSFLALSLIALGCSSTTEVRKESAPPPEPTAAPGALQTAHDAYLAGDFIGTGEAIRDVLLDPSSGSLAKENALELLDSTYEATNGNLPTRFTLPSGFTGITVGALRGTSKYGMWRSLFLWMRVKEGTNVDEIAVLSADGTPLLTKSTPNVRPQVKHIMAGYDDIALNLDKMDVLPADGVYTIHIGVDGKRVVDTWIITRHLEASASPVVTEFPEQTSDPRPTVKFEPFRSPESTPFEHRSLNVYVEESTKKVQSFYLWTPASETRTQVHIDKPLAPGAYWMSVTAQEMRNFGPISVERSAQTGLAFNVVP